MHLLKIDGSQITEFYQIGFFVLLSLIIWFMLLRWAVRADTTVKNQQAMIWFLILLCKKQGVPDEEIKKIRDHFRIE